MSILKSFSERLGSGWMSFWFPKPSSANLALMRIGAGIVLIYLLVLRSYDLEIQFSRQFLGNFQFLGSLAEMVWSFSIFNWFEGAGWMWTVHVFAIMFATAFLLGIYPSITGFGALLLHISYANRNPAFMVGLDGLVTLALFYLILMPSGRIMTVLWWRHFPESPPKVKPPAGTEISRPLPWGGLALRALQIHLCLLYFQSGLAKLNSEWMDGLALLHPRLVEKGVGIGVETLQEYPALLTLIPNILVLFELFYGVLIWLPRFRYPVLILAVIAHLTVGIIWEKLPFNLMMIILNLAFLPPGHLERLGKFLLSLVGPILPQTDSSRQ